MHRDGRKSWRWPFLQQSWQTLEVHHGAADQCPKGKPGKPWVESVHGVEMVAHLGAHILMDA